ncbi:Maintenance of telomere capping protein 2 [Coniochaeta hoffmannii]|uniref:magnesium chelatase n=1 Tax=Coniochaeta hoffmannii TaxID=91930 RepID=A0AA38SEN5_9PEZI|nr:Maintenance of telomere capping protein 2 [Coniochaeta hoffmannii]
MADEQLLSKVHSLSDLELAFLLSLIAREQCQFRTSSAAIPDLVAELRLVATKIFRLQPAVISCTPQTTLDDFACALLLPDPYSSTSNSPVLTARSASPLATRSPAPQRQHRKHEGPSSYFHTSATGHAGLSSANPSIAPVILAANLDTAPKAVQIQALELLRTRRVFTRTSVHTAPKTFLFVAIVSDDRQGEGLNRWLNDWFYLAHAHSPEDGYPNLEEDEEDDNTSEPHLGLGISTNDANRGPYPDTDAASTASSSSVVIKPPTLRRAPSSGTSARQTRQRNGKAPASSSSSSSSSSPPSFNSDDEPVITEPDISHLSQLAQHVHVDVDVTRYQLNLVSFLRMHRAVAPGSASPQATKHLEQLARSLAPLHGLDYVTPGLVRLAARKVYLHRIRIVAPERERSMQWGSELAAVEAVLDGVGPEDVIEDVLGMVTVPL